MPIRWTAELDSILLHGVFEECNISFSKGLCNKLAERVSATGQECSYKAVENRLYSWKKKNVTVNGNGTGNGTGNTPKKTPTKSAATTPKTPRSGSKKATPKSKAVTTTSDSESGPEGFVNGTKAEQLESPTAGRKRARITPQKSYAESDAASEGTENEYVPMAKRIKKEPVEASLTQELDVF